MKSNHEAELTILKYLCTKHDPAYLVLIQPKWFHSPVHRAVFEVLRQYGASRKLTYAELSNHLQAVHPETPVDVWAKTELFKENDIEPGEVAICTDIIEEKWKLRELESKLMDVHARMFTGSLIDVHTELIAYFHQNAVKKELIKSLDEDFESENKDLIEFGSTRPALNKLGALKNTVITIGGDSSHHKTNQLLDILIRALLHNYPKNPDFKVMLFSGEMSWSRIRDRIFAKMLQIELEKVTRRHVQPHQIVGEFQEKYPALVSNFYLISPSQFRSMSDLNSLVASYKPDVWGLDFLQYFAQMSAGNNAEQQNKNVMEAIAQIKILTEITNSLGIILSQLRKKSEQRLLHFPRMDDLEWSGLTKQISDIVGLCFWPYKINPSTAQMNWYTVSWQKVRDSEPFNEVLWVKPEFCDFMPHPTPNADRKYFDW